METFENNSFEPQQPDLQKPQRSEKKKGTFFRRAVSLMLVLALVAGGCGLTYSLVNARWEEQSQESAAAIAQMQRKLDSLNVTPSQLSLIHN